MMTVAVVVPTIREDRIQRWLREWDDQLCGTSVFVVEDNPEPTFAIGGANVAHFSWRDIDADLGDKSWIIPRRTSAIKSYGFLKAWQSGADVVWTLDDDCYPEPRVDYLREICETLDYDAPETFTSDTWWNTIEGAGVFPRGYPYGIRSVVRPVMVQHGLWSNIPDLDGLTQKDHPDLRLPPSEKREIVPKGAMFPMCGMNLAWNRDMTPAMYFTLQGQDAEGGRYPFDRFDDMWAGLMVKRICDHMGYAVASGAPSVCHDKASDVERNIELEAPGIGAHEKLWPVIANARLSSSTVKGCYLEIANVVSEMDNNPYWTNLANAMRTWALLFN